MSSALKPFAVLARLPGSTSLTAIPAAAVDGEQAMAIVSQQLIQQGQGEAMLVGAMDQATVASLSQLLVDVQKQIDTA